METEPIATMGPTQRFCLAGMSNKDWTEDDLNMGYRPTPTHANVPPAVGEEQIEGAQGTPNAPVVASSCSNQLPQMILEEPAQHFADDAFEVGRCYNNPDITANDSADHNVVVEQTYYKGENEEELDVDDNVPTKGRT